MNPSTFGLNWSQLAASFADTRVPRPGTRSGMPPFPQGQLSCPGGIVGGGAAYIRPAVWRGHRGNMRYVVDVYHQPHGYSQPVVKEQYRIVARTDAEAIGEAKAMFGGRDTPLVTGFAVRSIGSR